MYDEQLASSLIPKSDIPGCLIKMKDGIRFLIANWKTFSHRSS